MTGIPKPLIDKIASLDMDEIDELAETLGVSVFTLRFSDLSFSRLLQMPGDVRSTYAEAALVSTTRGGATFP
jgi:flagellar transcriptional activator FlhD